MYGGFWGRTNLALVLGVVGLFAATPASSADLGGDCCADLEERVAELEATTARKGNRKVSLTVRVGQRGRVLVGRRRRENVYVGTNLIEQSRFRFVGEAKIDKDWSAGYILELGVAAIRRTNGTNCRMIPRISTRSIRQRRHRPQEQLVHQEQDVRSDCRWSERHGHLSPARRRRFDAHAQRRRRGRRGDLHVHVPAAA